MNRFFRDAINLNHPFKDGMDRLLGVESVGNLHFRMLSIHSGHKLCGAVVFAGQPNWGDENGG